MGLLEGLGGTDDNCIDVRAVIAAAIDAGSVENDGVGDDSRKVLQPEYRRVAWPMWYRKVGGRNPHHRTVGRNQWCRLHRSEPGVTGHVPTQGEFLVGHDVTDDDRIPPPQCARAGGAAVRLDPLEERQEIVVEAVLGLDLEVARLPVHELERAQPGVAQGHAFPQRAVERRVQVSTFAKLLRQHWRNPCSRAFYSIPAGDTIGKSTRQEFLAPGSRFWRSAGMIIAKSFFYAKTPGARPGSFVVLGHELLRFDFRFFRPVFFFGTFLPLRRASDRPIAIACLRLFT